MVAISSVPWRRQTLQQVRPTSGFFRTNARRHVGCLAGPATTNFDLFLDQWTGRAWKTVANGAD